MADTRLLPAGINDERGRVLLTLIERLGNLDLSKTLIYRLVDIADDLLVNLADQFHVTGDEGWTLATTPEQQLALILSAIDLHRYRGTRWAVQQALTTGGYPEARIMEWKDVRDAFERDHHWFLDGAVTLDGTHTLSADRGAFEALNSRNWNEYHVELDIDRSTTLDVAIQDRIRRLAALHAPVRCRLLYLLHLLELELVELGRTLNGAQTLDGSYRLNALSQDLVLDDPPTEIAFGTGTTVASSLDIELEVEYLRKSIDTFDCTVSALSVNATLLGEESVDQETTEVGIFSASGKLLGRHVFAPKPLDERSRVGFGLEFAF